MTEKSFQSTFTSCRLVRSVYSKLFHGLPHLFSFGRDGERVMFLSSGCLYSHPLIRTSGESTSIAGLGNWRKLCDSGKDRNLSRSEQLLRERMRATGNGITAYDYIRESDSIVVYGSNCLVMDCQSESCVAEFPELAGATNHQICPSCPTLTGCVYEGDVWVLDAKSGKKHQLTFTAGDRVNTKLTAGQPSFIVQEEFDRYTGYWWQPKQKDIREFRILFEEVDEKNVENVYTFNPSSQGLESYCYPKAGTKNAQSSLKLLEFTFSENGEVYLTNKALPWTFSELFPECSEYVVRVGWMKDGEHVWVQLLDRSQKLLKVVIISVSSFVSDGSKARSPLPFLLWEERSETWINVTNILKFLPPSVPDATHEFLWCSDKSGYMHLYLITARRPEESCNQVLKAECSVQQLTSGCWVVFGSEVWVDTKHRVVFFEANKTSPLEKHLYGLSLDTTLLPCENPIQLTTSGCYHSVTVDADNHYFVTVFSNECSAPSVAVYSITLEPLSSTFLNSIWTGTAVPADYIPPSRFQVEIETGEVLHGEVYTPSVVQPGKKLPTILYVYGGPHIQLITRAFNKQLPRIKEWTHCGFVVVMLDNRGSANRGVKFESCIKDHLGEIELRDQVEGLKKALTMFDFIDDSRIAITGWSYGGYLSLLGIATYPHMFKVAISGAPVTDWLWYDTGYTERYLGITPNAESYQKSSVLGVCNKFPNESNRLLIIHGLNDENVLFTHTSLLCDKLVEFAKPYQLQLYTGERHGLRSPPSVAHCDATVLTFLLNNL